MRSPLFIASTVVILFVLNVCEERVYVEAAINPVWDEYWIPGPPGIQSIALTRNTTTVRTHANVRGMLTFIASL
jgi:hypothetical protein